MTLTVNGGSWERQRPQHVDARYERTKRSMDIAFAAISLLALAPLIILLMLLVWLDSPGGALFRQTRVGRGGQPFTLYKLRTFHAEHHGFYGDEEIRWNDGRITRIGRWLRRSKLDELLQLVNVLRGDMALVGPRPSMPEQVADYGPDERIRLSVRPGLTGVAQVSGNTWLDWSERMRMDRWYVTNRSPRLDLVIMLKTLPVMLRGERPTDDPLGIVATLALNRESVVMKRSHGFMRLQRAGAPE